MHPHVQGVGWFVRRSPDSVKLREYYSAALGFPQMRGRPQSMMFWVGETSIVQVSPGGQCPPVYTDRVQASCVPVFRVHGIEAVAEHIQMLGSPLINDLKGDGTRLIYFLDPSGNVFGLQERTRAAMRPDDHEAMRRWEAGATTVEGIPPVAVPGVQNLGWIVQRTADTKPVIAFYRDVLQLPFVGGTEDGSIAMLKLDDLQLLEIAPGGAEQPRPADRTDVNNAMILRVRDIAGMVDRLNAHGVEFVNPLFEGSGYLAYFLDPAGQLVGLQERKPDSPRPEDHEATRRWAAG